MPKQHMKMKKILSRIILINYNVGTEIKNININAENKSTNINETKNLF